MSALRDRLAQEIKKFWDLHDAEPATGFTPQALADVVLMEVHKPTGAKGRDSDKTIAEIVRATLSDVVAQLREDIDDDDVVCVARNRIFTALEERGIDIYTRLEL